jgi:cobalt transporter subunit CbtB
MREQDSFSAGRQIGLLFRSASLAGAILLAAPQAAARMLSAGVAIALGMIVLFGTGFAGPEILHNAAHDVRHGFAFPCH